MSKWKLFDTEVPSVSTFEFHEHRDRAPHWDQPLHRPRLEAAIDALERFVPKHGVIVDLGAGDGGLVKQLLWRGWVTYGYDFQPSNAAGWVDRGIESFMRQLDFVAHWDHVMNADAYVITECLEHLAQPHVMLQSIYDRLPTGGVIVASSPRFEHRDSHDECHAWAWDMEGYAEEISTPGFKIVSHIGIEGFQVIAGMK